jgi:hypothetical protein
MYFCVLTIKDKFIVSKPQLCFGGGQYKIPCEYEETIGAKALLQTLDTNGQILIHHLQQNYPNSYITKNLVSRYDSNAIREHSIYEVDDTSYTLNKGEVISICLRKGDGTFHDMDLLMYVYLHEMAHVAEDVEQHTNIFWNTYMFLMNEAKKIGIYIPIDYSQHPTMYCNKIPIKFNLYFNN